LLQLVPQKIGSKLASRQFLSKNYVNIPENTPNSLRSRKASLLGQG
jgi:hypothetical protein